MSQLRTTRRRIGSITIEALMVLFVLIIATIGAFQFGLALIVKQAVIHAASVAAREAAKGATLAELEDVVEQVLAGHQITLGAKASLVLEDLAGAPPVDQAGTFPCAPPVSPSLQAGDVRVTLCVSLDQAPFVNALKPYGSDFTSKAFTVSCLSRKE